MKNNITNDQIIQSARRQRQAVDRQMNVAPWPGRHRRQGRDLAAIAVAASIISFVAGFGMHAILPQLGTSLPDAQPLAQNILMKHDTIMQTTTVRDTIYQTRIVTKYVEQPVAQSAQSSSAYQLSEEQMACSMLCDDIPYELLATP